MLYEVITLGDDRAALYRPPFSLFGVIPWRIKEAIDRAFVKDYQPS